MLMALDAWLPIGFKLPDGAKVRVRLFEGADWQIYETMGGGRALVVMTLAQHWLDAGLIDEGTFGAFQFGDRQLRSISCGRARRFALSAKRSLPTTRPRRFPSPWR
jgi:cell division protease FtsH